jgi:hypothetical protein
MIIVKFSKIILFLVLLFTANSIAHAQNDVCRITSYFRDLSSTEPFSSSSFYVGGFDLQLVDDYDDVTKFFHHKESGVNITASATLTTKGFFKNNPKILNIAISFTAQPEDDDFELLNGAKAQTIYDKRWSWISISDDIKVGNRIYTFTLACERKNKKRTVK